MVGVKIMKTINLKDFGVVCKEFRGDKAAINGYLSHMSQRECEIKSIEVDTFIRLFDSISLNEKNHIKYNGFHSNYVIPQIGKEFDLLRVSNYQVLNIELKSTMTKNTVNQLSRNLYYFSVIEAEIAIFLYVMDVNKLYKFERNTLIEVEFNVLTDLIEYENVSYAEDLDEIFKVSNFLVSPLNSTDKFLKGQYFLTTGQAFVRKSIFEKLDLGEQFIALDAKAGTGKTLLLYDIALELALENNVLVIHCANLCNGHFILNQSVKNLTIISAKQARLHKDLCSYDYVLLDEAHRFYARQLSSLISEIESSRIQCIFSLDDEQRLAKSEVRFDNGKRIREMAQNNVFKLRGKIRTNKEIASFVVSLFDLSKSGNQYKYKNVDVVFAENHGEAKLMIESYVQQGYEYINITPSVVVSSSLDILNFGHSSHSAIGQEFDNVITYINQYYFYHNGRLSFKQGPNPDHYLTKLLYQNLTRVREKLCLVVVGNKQVFKTIFNILTKK